MAEQVTVIQEYGLIICNACAVGVQRRHVHTHFRTKHGARGEVLLSLDQYLTSMLPVEEWLCTLPVVLPRPLPRLLVYSPCVRCTFNAGCIYVARTSRTILQHLKEKHNWTMQDQRGRPTRKGQAGKEQPWRDVRAQRVFLSGANSRYIEVLHGGEEGSIAAGRTIGVAQRMEASYNNALKRKVNVIQAGKASEMTPWLARTGWTRYFHGAARTELLALLQEPTKQVEEVSTYRAWHVTLQAIEYAQHTTIGLNLFLRQEVLRTTPDQKVMKPIQAYLDGSTLGRNARPWQQLIVLFVRQFYSPEAPTSAKPILLPPKQKACLTAFLHVLEGMEEGISFPSSLSYDQPLPEPHQACILFCLSLLEQTACTEEYEVALIAGLAYLGVQEEGWRTEENYPTLLSAVLKCSRFMLLQHITTTALEEPILAVKRFVRSYMMNGTSTAVDWMISLRAYGMKIALGKAREGRIAWSGEVVSYGEITLSMDGLRGFVRSVLGVAQTILHKELLFDDVLSEPIPAILWSTLCDNNTDVTPYGSFLSNPMNSLPVDGETWLYQHVQKNRTLREQFLPDKAIQPWPQAVGAYLSAVTRLRTKLLTLLHITGGQPARVPELLSIRFRNTAEGGLRNIFLYDGYMNLRTTWHKGQTISDQPKIIDRFLPREVGELLVRYLWLVSPFQERLEAFYGEREEFGSLLWPYELPPTYQLEKPWTDDRARRIFREEVVAGLGVPLSVRSYRQLAIAIGRRYLPKALVFANLYPELDAYAEIYNARHNEDSEEEDIMALQAAHSTSTGASSYGRLVGERDGELFTIRERFFRASLAWHTFLGFRTVRSHKQARDAPCSREQQTLQAAVKKRWQEHVHASPLQRLQQLLGPLGSFRPMQEEAVKAVVRKETPILCIFPTGAGKSMLFLVPASYDREGTTVVIVPLLALRQQFRTRCEQVGVTCVEWDGRSQPPPGTQIILLTPESAGTKTFKEYITGLQVVRKLDRIVVDECHMLLHGQGAYRKAFQSLASYSLLGVPLLFLTATLPPTLERSFHASIALSDVTFTTFRRRTTRTNLAYRPREVLMEDRLATIQELLEEAGDGRVIIYSRTRQTAEEIGHALECPVYHAAYVGRQASLSLFSSGVARVLSATSALSLGFDLPDVRMVVHYQLPYSMIDYVQESGRGSRDGQPGTSILLWETTELRQPKVDPILVQLLTTPECLRVVLDEYMDGVTSRTQCGEDGQEEACINCLAPVPSYEDAGCIADLVEEGLPLSSIRSSPSSSSSLPRLSSSPLAATDSYDDRTFQRVQERAVVVRTLAQQSIMMKQGLFLDMDDVLQRAFHTCMLCLVEGRPAHLRTECTHPDQTRFSSQVKFVRGNLTLASFAGCFGCGLPMAQCQRWRPTEKSFQRRPTVDCQYPGLLYHGVAGMLWQTDRTYEVRVLLMTHLKEECGRTDMTERELLGQLGQKLRTQTLETCFGFKYLLLFLRTLLEPMPTNKEEMEG